MANLPNAKKALRQSKKHRESNRQYKSRIKKVARLLDDAVKSNNLNKAEKMLPAYFKAIDKATKRNILHKNTASRRKSLYARKISRTTAPTAEPQQVDKKAQDAIAATNNSQAK